MNTGAQQAQQQHRESSATYAKGDDEDIIELTEVKIKPSGPAVQERKESKIIRQKNRKTKWFATLYRNYTELEPLWRRMESEGHCTAFQTYDWVASWYSAAVAAGLAEPLVMVVSREGEQPSWILPLCLHKEKGLRKITFADLQMSDYASPLISAHAPTEPETVQAMIRAVVKALPPCDIVHFEKIIPQTVKFTNPLMQLEGLELFRVGCHGIRLSEPWKKLKDRNMQKRMRSGIRAKTRKIKEKGKLIVKFHHEPEEMGPLLDELLAIRQERFKALGRPTLPAEWRHFYHMLAARPNRHLEVNILTLSVGKETIAYCFGVTYADRFYALLPTFDMKKWARYKPGLLLFDAVLKTIEDKTDDFYFDFTVGDEPYKTRFGAESHNLYEWMKPRSLRGLVPYGCWRAKGYLRRHPELYRNVLELKARLKKALARGKT